jgi:hypothetical protein
MGRVRSSWRDEADNDGDGREYSHEGDGEGGGEDTSMGSSHWREDYGSGIG